MDAAFLRESGPAGCVEHVLNVRTELGPGPGPLRGGHVTQVLRGRFRAEPPEEHLSVRNRPWKPPCSVTPVPASPGSRRRVGRGHRQHRAGCSGAALNSRCQRAWRNSSGLLQPPCWTAGQHSPATRPSPRAPPVPGGHGPHVSRCVCAATPATAPGPRATCTLPPGRPARSPGPTEPLPVLVACPGRLVQQMFLSCVG